MEEIERWYICERDCTIDHHGSQRVGRGFMLKTSGPCPPHFRQWEEDGGDPDPPGFFRVELRGEFMAPASKGV